MKMTRIAACGVFALATSLVHAAPLFSDDFNADTLALNKTSFLGGWTVTGGTVDLIGTGFFDFVPANIRYVDLDGSSGTAGLFSKNLTLNAGQTYIASFDLAGSHRGSTETVTVDFGGSAVYTLSSADGFATHSLIFTPGVSGTYALSFQNRGGDNIGALLDNVRVSALPPVPEPETYALMLAGLGTIGLAARRRSR